MCCKLCYRTLDSHVWFSSEAEKHIFGLLGQLFLFFVKMNMCKNCICSFSHTIFICVHRISIQGSSSTGSIKSQFFFHKQRVQVAETIPPKRKLIQFNSLGKRSLLLNQCIYQLWWVDTPKKCGNDPISWASMFQQKGVWKHQVTRVLVNQIDNITREVPIFTSLMSLPPFDTALEVTSCELTGVSCHHLRLGSVK